MNSVNKSEWEKVIAIFVLIDLESISIANVIQIGMSQLTYKELKKLPIFEIFEILKFKF